MEESDLIKILILIGVVCISIIYASYILLEKSARHFASYFMPQIFCEQDEKGEFILGKKTSYEVCEKINDMKSLIDHKICENYYGDRKEACMNLVDIAKKREADCENIIYKITSVTQEEVEANCQVFNITRKLNYTSILI